MGDASQVAQLLTSASSGTVAGRGAMQQLEGFVGSPQAGEFFAVVGQLLCNDRDNASVLQARELAALFIKRFITVPACGANPAVQRSILQSLNDPSPAVRRAVSSAITTIVSVGGLDAWSVDVIAVLIQATGGDTAAASGAMITLSKLCEDHCVLLDAVANKTPTIIAAIVPFMLHDDVAVRADAMEAVVYLLEHSTVSTDGPAYQAFNTTYASVVLQNLSTLLGAQQNSKIRRLICKTIVYLLAYGNHMLPAMPSITPFMLEQTKDRDEDIAMEACEFWSTITNFPHLSNNVPQLASQLVPLLLDRMVYSDLELSMLDAGATDWQVPDKMDDVRPRQYQQAVRAGEDEEEEEEEDVDQWNLRRCAATALDELAETYGNAILNDVLAGIDQRMQPSANWRQMEAGIMALGAVAEGCITGIEPFLPQIVPRLLALLNDANTNFLVRAMTCWCLSRYRTWIHESPELSQQCIAAIGGLIKSQSKRVQEAATTAMIRFTQAFRGDMQPYAAQLFTVIQECFTIFQLKNTFVLYELVESLCVALKRHLAEDEQVMGCVLNPLIQKWGTIPNDSFLILPLFKCLSVVCAALGPAIQGMAEGIYSRGFGQMEFHVTAREQAKKQNIDPPDSDFLITAVDLVGGLCEALGSSVEPLIAANANFMNLVMACLQDESDQIRLSALGLIGELAKSLTMYVQKYLEHILPLMHQCLDPRYPELAANAAWAYSELVVNQLQGMDLPVVTPQHFVLFLTTMAQILVNPNQDDDLHVLHENIVCAIGRTLQADPSTLQNSGQRLGSFFGQWCFVMRNVGASVDKDQATSGMLGVAINNLGDIATPESMQGLLDVAVSFKQPSGEIHSQLLAVMQALQQQCPQQWAAAIQAYPPHLKQRLLERYGVK